MRNLNLVVPLSQKDTAKHSGAITQVIGHSLRMGDVNSTNKRSTRLTTPSIRTSMMATRTTTTRTTSSGRVPFANPYAESHAGFLFEDVVKAYFDCRRTKRNSASATDFEVNLERNLIQLHDELTAGTYMPGKSICFVVTRPKAREVWAAEFRDRIVHHLLYNHISPRFYAGFIADSCACIPGRGTLYAVERLESKIRSATQNWSQPCYYMKLDLANFFVSIDKRILHAQLATKIIEPQWLALAELILFHDPRDNYELRGDPSMLNLVPQHKRLTSQPSHNGLPIGNLSSQFFANVLLNDLDQFVKHQLRAKHYTRYVDDFILLHESPQQLNKWLAAINEFLPSKLGVKINPKKTIIQPVDRGVDFVGQVIKPWRRTTRRRVVKQAIQRVRALDKTDVFETANSYFGLFRQASHSRSDRIKLSKAVHSHGKAVNKSMTKTYRGAA